MCVAMTTRDIENLTPEQVKVLNQALFEEWDAKVSTMKKEAEKIDVDPKKIKPSDIGVLFGQAMDEEMFAEYRKRRDGRMKVISPEDLQKMMGPQK